MRVAHAAPPAILGPAERARLHARTLFGQHGSPPSKSWLGADSKDGGVKREDVIAIQHLVKAVVVAWPGAKEQRVGFDCPLV